MADMKYFTIIILLLFNSIVLPQKPVIRQPVNFLALGDSYTIGQSVGIQDAWPNQFANYLKSIKVNIENVTIIAQTGWTTGNLKDAIKNSNISGKTNLVSLLIGVNNQYRGLEPALYEKEFEELLNTAIQIAGGENYVFVLSIPDYGYTPFGAYNQENISQEIDKYNAINFSITSRYNVAYINITGISRLGLIQPELVATDGLHPSAEMYRLWVDLIAKGIKILDGTTYEDQNKFENDLPFKVSTENESIKVELIKEIREGYIEIYDMSGKKVKSIRIFGQESIKVNNKGIYIYTIKAGKQNYNGKIMVN
jgi:lysophospholipase L1-like esterase